MLCEFDSVEIGAKSGMKSKSATDSFPIPSAVRERGREGKRIIPDVRDVIKLSDYVMPVILTCETIFTLYLWAKVSENQHSWVVLTHEDRSNEDLKVFQ